MTQPVAKWEEGIYIKIRLEPDCVGLHPLGHEAVVVVNDGDDRYAAWVPTHTLGKDYAYVPGRYVGRVRNLALVALPVGNDGATTWRIPEDRLPGLLFE